MNSNFADVHFNKAGIYLLLGMKDRAEASYLKAVELTPDHPIFYEKLVKYYLNISNVDQAKILFKKGL